MHPSSSAARFSIAKTQSQSARSGSAPTAALRSSSNVPTTSGAATMTASPSSTSPTITTLGDKIMRRSSKQERDKELRDHARLIRAWEAFHREEREAALAGPHGTMLNELFRMFANLKHASPSQLIGFARTIDWAAIDYRTRLVVVHEVNNSITTFRTKRGLEPIDDGLPG